MRQSYSAFLVGLAIALCSILSGSRLVAAQEAISFQGKTITLVVGTAVGGSDYDVNGRLLARHLSRHIPGRPTIIVQNMPGAASTIAGNYIHSIAPQDGSMMAMLLNTLPLGIMLKQVNAQFSIDKLQWIGNSRKEVSYMVATSASGVKTIADAQKKSITMGATSPSALNGLYPKILNDVAGTRFRVVAGYKSPQTIDVAIESGEIDGRAGATWYGSRSAHYDSIQQGKINILLQVGLQKADDLPHVPSFSDLGKTEEDHALIALFTSPTAIGKPLAVGPRVPGNIVALLRDAYLATLADGEFLKEADKLGMQISPMSGEELAKTISSVMSTPANVIARAQRTIK